MGKTRPPERSKLQKKHKKQQSQKRRQDAMNTTPEMLLAQATVCLQQGQADSALEFAANALQQLQLQFEAEPEEESNVYSFLPALNLLGEINVELGQVEEARECFTQAAEIDEDGDIPEEVGGGPEKFMWLAQLSEEGGLDSVKWYQKGIQVLRQQIETFSGERENLDSESQVLLEELLKEKKAKLATALCGIAEVYMTDLSWDDKEAEAACEKVMTEALELAPNNPETLQTYASVRISQQKTDEAQEFLTKSLDLWKDLPEESLEIPDFAVRISLVRLLMEVGLAEEAIEVVGRLAQEDDTSVETWYLGGWCFYLMAEKLKMVANGHTTETDAAENNELLVGARRWLLRCLKLYRIQDYEDEKLRDHAQELVAQLNSVLGEPAEDEADAYDDDEDDEDEPDVNDMEMVD
jgi:tetratricopeptide (TPR) repeat protein